MRQPPAFEHPSTSDGASRRTVHPFLAWLGWTALWLIVTALFLAIIRAVRPESFAFWFMPVLAALLVGFASRSRSFMLSPVVVGLVLAAGLAYATNRYDNTMFAAEAGFIILWVMLAIVGFGSLLAAVVGVVAGTALADRRRRAARPGKGESRSPTNAHRRSDSGDPDFTSHDLTPRSSGDDGHGAPPAPIG